MTDVKVPDGFELEGWTYAGRREKAKGGLGFAWIDRDGREAFYAKTPHVVIGGVYELAVKREDGKVSAIFAGMQYRGRNADVNVPELEAHDRAAYTADQVRLAEARDKREGADEFGKLTLSDVRELMSGGVPWAQRQALLTRVITYVMGG